MCKEILLYLKVENMFICYETVKCWFLSCFHSITTNRKTQLLTVSLLHVSKLLHIHTLQSYHYVNRGRVKEWFISPGRCLPTLGITHKTYYPEIKNTWKYLWNKLVILISLILVQLNGKHWWLAQVVPLLI